MRGAKKRSVAFLLAMAGCGGMLFDFGGTIIAPAIPYFEALGLYTAPEISRLTAAVVLTAAATVVYFVTAAFFLPEMKGKSLADIERIFECGEKDKT